jgi:hypothetical protein
MARPLCVEDRPGPSEQPSLISTHAGRATSSAQRTCGLTREYRAAYAKAEACDPVALSAFAALLSRDTSDVLTSFHLKRLLVGATGVAVALE